MTKNNAISFDALPSFSLFILFNSLIALIPRGVAALDSPNILAVKFITMAPIASSLWELSLNIFFNIGFNNFATLDVNPLFSAIFITPHQKHIIPTKEIINFTAPSEDSVKPVVINSPWPVIMLKINPKAIIANHI